MNKNEYLRTLARELRKLPREEFDRAMDYYTEYFEDAGPENEQEVIRDLGTPQEVASQLIMDAAIKRMEEPVGSAKKGVSAFWVVILGICAAPIALPMILLLLVLLGCLLITVITLIGCAVIVDLSALATGIVMFFVGIYLLFSLPASGIALIGCGMIAFGIGIFGGFIVIFIAKCMFRGIRALFKAILKRGRKK